MKIVKIISVVALWILLGISGTEYMCNNTVSDKQGITYWFYISCSLSGPIVFAPIAIHEFGGSMVIERFSEE